MKENGGVSAPPRYEIVANHNLRPRKRIPLTCAATLGSRTSALLLIIRHRKYKGLEYKFQINVIYRKNFAKYRTLFNNN